MQDFLIDEFYQQMQNKNFQPYGILDSDDKIHTLGTDSKIISRTFEMFVQPILEIIAHHHGLILKTPDSQTVYPDFIMMSNENSKEKIAIDVKTTYINSEPSPIKFTLGSYTSYMRNNTKNIEFEYTDYIKHYVIGFIYKRNGQAQESQIFEYSNRHDIQFPVYDIRYFIQEKYKIAGDKPGSGNTENIGSFSTKDFYMLKNGMGPFNSLGADVFDIYWKYYPKYRSEAKSYTSLNDFTTWFCQQKPQQVQILHPYDYQDSLARIKAYANSIKQK